MKEYQHILSLYQKHKQYGRKIILFSLGLIVLASIISAMDIIRISPFFIYMAAMGVAIYYARRIRVEGKNYGKLEKFLKQYEPKALKNKEFVFFLEYQLTNYFEKSSDSLGEMLSEEKDWTNQRVSQGLKELVAETKNYYDYLVSDMNLAPDTEISLEWYKKTIENRNQDVI